MNHCLHHATRAESNNSLAPIVKTLNVAHIQSAQNLLSEIAISLEISSAAQLETVDEALKSKNNARTSKSKPLIFVLDEIDMLISGTTQSKDNKSILNTIFQWASDPSYRLILIGISNSVGNKDAKKFHSLAKVS